jgi:hypothetical protein
MCVVDVIPCGVSSREQQKQQQTLWKRELAGCVPVVQVQLHCSTCRPWRGWLQATCIVVSWGHCFALVVVVLYAAAGLCCQQ